MLNSKNLENEKIDFIIETMTEIKNLQENDDSTKIDITELISL